MGRLKVQHQLTQAQPCYTNIGGARLQSLYDLSRGATGPVGCYLYYQPN